MLFRVVEPYTITTLYDGILTFVGNIIIIIKIIVITNMFRVPETLREHLTMKRNI